MDSRLRGNDSKALWHSLAMTATLFFQIPFLYSQDSPDLILQQVTELRSQNLYDQAENILKAAISEHPANPELHLEMANLYAARYDGIRDSRDEEAKMQALGLAESELKLALSLDPNLVPAMYNLGVIHKRMGQYEEAREMFRTVLEVDNKQTNAWMQIGATYEEQGFFQEARDAYERARELDYGNTEIRSAIEDLVPAEQKWKEKQRQTTAFETMRLPRQSYRESETSFSQTIPYLGSWLVQEFMKVKSRSKSVKS